MNEKPDHISDEVLVRYLVGEATQEEQQSVKQWIDASEENKRYFDHFRLILEERDRMAKPGAVNANDAWERFVARTEREEAEQPKARTIPFRSGWTQAAAVVVLLGMGWLIYMFAGGSSELVASSGNTVLVQTLPDGSTVTLNKNSTLSYPKKFKGDIRSVALKGEAFFSITPDKQHPFIITAGEAAVQVVGTTFNVKTTNEETEVIVETGIVQVSKRQNAMRVLPHQVATVSKNSAQPRVEQNTDELYNYYRTKEFVCHGTPLWKLVEVLNTAYDAHIVIESKKTADLRLETTFRNESLDDIINVISSTFNIEVQKQGGQIILK